MPQTKKSSRKRAAPRKSSSGQKKSGQKKHLRGVSSKEQRQYEHIEESARRSGRYGKRAKEVAARTVMKKHKSKAHKKGQ